MQSFILGQAIFQAIGGLLNIFTIFIYIIEAYFCIKSIFLSSIIFGSVIIYECIHFLFVLIKYLIFLTRRALSSDNILLLLQFKVEFRSRIFLFFLISLFVLTARAIRVYLVQDHRGIILLSQMTRGQFLFIYVYI